MSKRAIGTGLMAEHRALEALVAHSKGCCLEAHSNLLSLLPKSPFYCLRSSGFQGEDGFYILRKYLLKGQGIALKRGFCFGFFSLVKPPSKREWEDPSVSSFLQLLCLIPPHPQAVSVPLPNERPLSSSTSTTSRACTKQWCNEASRK